MRSNEKKLAEKSSNQGGTGEDEKAKAAAIFYDKYKQAETNPIYSNLKKEWKTNFG